MTTAGPASELTWAQTGQPVTLSWVQAGQPSQGYGGGSGSGGYVLYQQTTPATVWGPVVHNFGRRPASVSLFSLDYATQYEDFVVQHLDENSLRVSMDVPMPGVALISTA